MDKRQIVNLINEENFILIEKYKRILTAALVNNIEFCLFPTMRFNFSYDYKKILEKINIDFHNELIDKSKTK